MKPLSTTNRRHSSTEAPAASSSSPAAGAALAAHARTSPGVPPARAAASRWAASWRSASARPLASSAAGSRAVPVRTRTSSAKSAGPHGASGGPSSAATVAAYRSTAAAAGSATFGPGEGGDLGPVEAGVAAEHVGGRLPERQRHLLQPGGQAVEGVGDLGQVPAQPVGPLGRRRRRARQVGGHPQDATRQQRVAPGLLAPGQQQLLLGQDEGEVVAVGRLLAVGRSEALQLGQVAAALGGPPAEPGGGEVVHPPLVGAEAQLTALGGKGLQHRVQNRVERPSCRTCHVRSLSYTRHARRLRRAPRGPAKSGANPALSRNCEAPPHPAGTSQVACLRGRKLSPRRKGGLCL